MQAKRSAYLPTRDSVRDAARLALRSLMRLSGRNAAYRMGRFVVSEARYDVPNNPACNGERMVQATIVAHTPNERSLVVLDIGANVGDWSSAFLEIAGENPSLQIHAFEPCRGTYAILVNRLCKQHIAAQVVAVPQACSSLPGTAALYLVGVGAGTNSLTCAEGSTGIERVSVTAIDEYSRQASLDHITMIKIDAEGHDLEVIRGALGMLQRQAIDVLQFEYNRRWISGHFFLRDAFEFLGPLGYSIGKITPYGVEFYGSWDYELETFREGNYLACRSDWVRHFKRIVPTWNNALSRDSRG